MSTATPAQGEDSSHDSSRGAIIRIFGVILVILGTLDSMLMWWGGFAVNSLYVGLIASGLFLYLIGSILRRNRA